MSEEDRPTEEVIQEHIEANKEAYVAMGKADADGSYGVTVRHVEFPGDWAALYVDGELVAENHRIDLSDLFDEIEGEKIDEATSGWVSVELAQFGGGAPDSYEELEEAA